MATALTPVSVLGGYRTLPVTALSLDVLPVAADVTGNTWVAALGDVLHIRNSGATPRVITITSFANSRTLERVGDLVYTLGAGLSMAYAVDALDGLVHPDTGIMTVTCAHAECLVLVTR